MVSPNVFSETRAMTHGYDGNRDQSPLHPFIKALPVADARGSQQPLRLNRNAERRRRRCTHCQQTGVVATAYVARINVSYETREANNDEGKSRRKTPPKASELNLQGVRINSCEPNGLLIVDNVKFTISKQSSLSPPLFDTKREVRFQPRICATKRDARVHELRVSAPKCGVRVQPQRATHVQPKAASGHDLSVRESLTVLKDDLRVSIQKRRHVFSRRLRQNEIIAFHFRNARFAFSPKRPCSNMN